jgi:hypothetical protein
MNTRFYICLFLMILVSLTILCGQTVSRVTITGRVLDDSTSAPLQNVDVFLARTTLGSGTDQAGQFSIANIPAGAYELVASRVGYVFVMVRAMLSDSGKKDFTLRLKPSPVQVGEVVVNASDDRPWHEQLKKFVNLFLGKSTNAQRCRILNPEVLDFESAESDQFIATARAPLEIDNRSLGYHIRFILTQFRVGGLDVRYSLVKQYGRAPEVLSLEGYPAYAELKSIEEGDSVTWKKNRRKAYLGSLRHFLVSLFHQEVIKNGFEVSAEPFVSTKEWEPLRRGVSEGDILFGASRQQEKKLKFNRFLEIEYTKATLDPDYDLLVKGGTDNQVSWLMLNRESVTVDSRGFIREWFPTVAYGYWAWQRMADAVPSDYEPDE